MQNSIKSSAVSPTVKLRWNCFEVSVEMGDITQVHTDMILTTCDPIISCTNGVAKAIVEKGGERLQDAIDSRMVNEVRLHFGDVLVLNAESLNAWCVAFVCPSRGSFRDLKEAYYNALKEAMYLGAKTIAMPGFGTGEFGASAYVSASAALSAIFDTGIALTSIKSIRIVDINADTVCAFREELRKRSSQLSNAILFFNDDTTTPSPNYSMSQAIQSENYVRESPLDRFIRVVPSTAHSSDEVLHAHSEGVASVCDQNDGEICAVCLEKLYDDGESVLTDCVVELKRCKHVYHRDCLEQAFSRLQAQCPLCKQWYGAPQGNQPPGSTMTIHKYPGSVPGFSDAHGYFCIEYNVPSGVQSRNHPRPGVRFSGVRRYAYLPINAEGEKILQLFKLAFSNRLMFTVGDSVSTGQCDVVIFNGIHNKTNLFGGPQNFGYPDANYFARVREELAAVGITEKLLEDEYC